MKIVNIKIRLHIYAGERRIPEMMIGFCFSMRSFSFEFSLFDCCGIYYLDAMSSQSSSSGSGSKQGQEFLLRVPKNVRKRYHVMRFHAALKVDVSKWTQVKMERENNLKDFRAEEDAPKFGAGSEFGREQREEARRKKYGIIMKKYNPDEQPWMLRVGGKAGKKFRGIREGGIAENASYYVFVKALDGSFEAFPVEEWYNFTPVQRYKTLNAEEAEEEFGRRDKVLNYFSIMLRKRLKNEEGNEKEEGEEKQKKKPGKYGTGSGDFKISDMDDWINSSDADSEDEKEDEINADSKQKNKKKPVGKKKKKKESDDEALEDSDDGDGEGREVDYISDESSSSEDLPGEKSKGELKGVEDEDAIRKMEDSESEEENEEEKKENPDETKEEPSASKSNVKDKKEAKKTASSSESSSDTSDSDDFDNDSNFHPAVFMLKSKRHKDSGSNANSRSNTPTRNENMKREHKSTAEKGSKRAIAAVESSSVSSPPAKKMKSSTPSQSSNPVASLPRPSTDIVSDGITEDAVRRYLMRKPMTTTELLHKFKSKKTGLSREQMVNTIAQILKRLNPDKHTIKDKMYLSIKQT